MKLHLGCGTLKLPGYKSVDIRPETGADIIADVRNLHMIEDNSVDEIYFCHGMEHVPECEVWSTLEEWLRILKSGSWLYLSVPDFEILAGLYFEGGWRLVPPISSAIMGGQDHEYNYHFSIWDEEKLSHALESAGYHRIARYDAWGYLPMGFVDWSVREVRGQCLSLNMRALA